MPGTGLGAGPDAVDAQLLGDLRGVLEAGQVPHAAGNGHGRSSVLPPLAEGVTPSKVMMPR